jgi:hypothetical protein
VERQSTAPSTARSTGPVALVIEVGDFGASLVQLPTPKNGQLAAINKAIGYYEEIGDGSWLALINTDARRLRLPHNLHADVLARALGWVSRPGSGVLLGRVMFVCRKGANLGDCPQRVIDLARAEGLEIA